MAFVTGTASNHIDLWNKLLDFLQNNTDLVAAGQNWEVVWNSPSTPTTELVLKGPGLAGVDEVYVGMRRADETFTAEESLIYVTGMTGVLPSATTMYGHINVLSRAPAMFLDFDPMAYWFVANGRRFIVVVKMGTVFNAMYGGFFLPYAPPANYPYPMFCGGSRGFQANYGSLTTNSWRDGARDGYNHFVMPRAKFTSTNSRDDSQGCFLSPQGGWRGITVDTSDVPGALPLSYMAPNIWPNYLANSATGDTVGTTFSGSNNTSHRLGYQTFQSRLLPGLNGEVPLERFTIHDFSTSGDTNPVMYGVLDGCFMVPGLSNAAENIITIAGVDHLVVPNVMRSGARDYWALALE